jgi:hypothetical protein
MRHSIGIVAAMSGEAAIPARVGDECASPRPTSDIPI